MASHLLTPRVLRATGLAIALTLSAPLLRPFAVTPAVAQGTEPAAYNTEQLDALLAPIALYPDELLTQVLMATTYPVQIVEASRWLAQPGNAGLSGEALAKTLESQSWDPSVKSLVPFPQVLQMLDGKLDWTQQSGYAFATQQADVMNSIQRLRAQAQQAGSLSSTPQQTVSTEQGSITIQPANPQTVYVPVYNPTVVYGTWPYPAYPPAYLPPPPGYAFGSAFVSGLAFATGVAVIGSLSGWAHPGWGGGNVNVNVNRWNNINANRGAIKSGTWRPPPGGVGGRPLRAPGGPVGAPARLNGLPANAIGRNSVSVPGGLVSRPAPGRGQAANRAPGTRSGQAGGRPGGATGQATNRTPRAAPQRPPGNSFAQRGGGAFGGMSNGARAAQYGSRGAQSRSFQANRGGTGGVRRAGGGGGRRR